MPKHQATWNPARTVWETTAVALFCGHSVPFSETLPTSGMTRRGELFEHPMSGPATDGNGYSSSPTLPTPKARDHKGAATSEVEAGNPRGRLDVEVMLLPTPRAEPGATRARQDYHANLEEWAGHQHQGTLHLLPTPAVNDMGDGKTPDDWDRWTERMQTKHGNGNGHGKSLAIEAQRMLPTPKATNNENQQSLDRYGPNLGMVLQNLTGDHTPTPSTDGSES